MRYRVYSVNREANVQSHSINASGFVVEEGAYIFYEIRKTEPTAVFPVRSYYVKKEG